ncbi:hypothetical protein DFH27DRAFT_501113 [Peziza echinospora]|nr:hypothetical protein DFH27DRAFT_501113 [Peziza echinospora]
MAAIVVPREYGLVLATFGATSLISYWHGFVVGTARKAAKVGYPNTYATHEEAEADPAKYAFNCAQRGHANYLENLPIFVPALLLSGLKYPLTSTALGVTWIVGRGIFMIGYKNSKKGSDGKGRYKGFAAPLAQIALTLMSLYTAYEFAVSAL